MLIENDGIALCLDDGDARITPGWRVAGIRLEGDGGPFVKGDLAENQGYFYGFFHKYVRFVRSKAFFLGDIGVDGSNRLMLSMLLSRGVAPRRSFHFTTGR